MKWKQKSHPSLIFFVSEELCVCLYYTCTLINSIIITYFSVYRFSSSNLEVNQWGTNFSKVLAGMCHVCQRTLAWYLRIPCEEAVGRHKDGGGRDTGGEMQASLLPED